MKATYIIKTCLSLLFVPCLLCLGSCSKKDNQMNLDGDCRIETLTLNDSCTAVINHTLRTAVVRIPKIYDETAMTVTAITLSPGAKATLRVGDQLNMLTAHSVRVTNNDVFLDYTLSVKHDEVKILGFSINGQYEGIINEKLNTIFVQVPGDLDVTSLIPNVTMTEGGVCTPANAVACDFTNPVLFTAIYKTDTVQFTVTVRAMTHPKYIFVGQADRLQRLTMEEQVAGSWMLSNVDSSAYASFADLAAGKISLARCKVIWWHFNVEKTNPVQSFEQFEYEAEELMKAPVLDTLKAYYQRGGSFLLSRYATFLPAYMGQKKVAPDNCWGNPETNAEVCGGPWDFNIAGYTACPLYQGVKFNGDPNKVPTTDQGYKITNTTTQFLVGEHRNYATIDEWRTATGAKELNFSGGTEVAFWEFPVAAPRGGIVCIGSGTFDWYSPSDDYLENFHTNVPKITENAINYLSK